MNKAFHGLLALVCTVALAGCPATGFFSQQTTPQNSSLLNGKGSLSIKIQWPEQTAHYRTQNLPYRATTVAIAVQDTSGTTVLDNDGSPCVATLTRSYSFSNQNFVLAPQKNLTVSVVASDLNNVRVGAGTRSVDVIPDFDNNIEVEIIADDAPVIQGIYPATSDINPNPAPTTALNFDTTYTVKGTNFGASKGYGCQASVVLHKPNGRLSRFSITTNRISDTEMQINIPSGIGYDDFQNNYLLDSTGNTLSLDVTVDGANAPVQPAITLPKTGSITTAIGILNGTNATASTGYVEQFDVQSIRDFQMATSSGSAWVYTNLSDGTTVSFRINNNVYPPLEATGSNPCNLSLDPANYHFPDFPYFLQMKGYGQLQNLGTESIKVGTTTYTATHYYCPIVLGAYQAPVPGMNAWFATDVGLVKYKLADGQSYQLTSFVKP